MTVEFIHFPIKVLDSKHLAKMRRLEKKLLSTMPPNFPIEHKHAAELYIGAACDQQAIKTYRVTACYGIDSNSRLHATFSFCSPEDNFSRVVGRTKAFERMTSGKRSVISVGPDFKCRPAEVESLLTDVLYNSIKHKLDNVQGVSRTWSLLLNSRA